eukprot:691732-Rhodomonas_salina.2
MTAKSNGNQTQSPYNLYQQCGGLYLISPCAVPELTSRLVPQGLGRRGHVTGARGRSTAWYAPLSAYAFSANGLCA